MSDSDTFLLVGDTHGNTEYLVEVINLAASVGIHTIYQLGDFGIWPGNGGRAFIEEVTAALAANDSSLYAVLGNHEDYDQIERKVADGTWIEQPDGKILVSPHYLWLLGNKSAVWEDFGLNFASLGGAVSIDKHFRKPHVSWWEQELITADDLEILQHRVKRWVSDIDVLLTHDSPTSLEPWPGFFKADILSEISRQNLDRAHEIVQPRYWFHGHYHRDLDYRHKDTRVVGLGSEPWGNQDHYDPSNTQVITVREDKSLHRVTLDTYVTSLMEVGTHV